MITFLNTTGALCASCCIRPHVFVFLYVEHLGIAAEIVACLTIEFDTGEKVESMLNTNIEVVCGSVRPCPFHVVGLRNRGGRCVVVHHVGMPCVGNGMYECSIVVDTEVRTKHQTLQWVDVDVAITENTPYFQCVVAVVFQFAQRVLTVTHTADRTGESGVVFFINRQCRRHLQGIFHRCAIHLVGIGDGQILTHGNQFVHLERTVHTSGDVLEVGVLQNTLIVFVSQGHQQSAALCGIAQRKVITL